MGKTIGLFACASLVAASVWWASSQQTSQAVLAQIDSGSDLSGPPGFGAPPSAGDERQMAAQMARINDMMQKAHQMEQRGNKNAAVRFASSADGMVKSGKVPLNPGVESPAQFVARLQGRPTMPSAVSPGAQAPGNPFAAASQAQPSRPAPTLPGSDSPAKRQAQEMLQQARYALNKGDLDTARSLALEAQKVSASWTLYEESPDQILGDIERKGNTTTFTPKPSANPFVAESPEAQTEEGNPFAAPPTPPKTNGQAGNPFAVVQPKANAAPPANQNEINKAQASSLIASAKADAQAGRFAEAKKKLQQAEQLEVFYTTFDERPELVLEDVNRMESEGQSVAQAAPAVNAPGDAAKREQAQRLLEQARVDIKNAQFDQAKAKVAQARQLNVAYTQFDDTPELVSEFLKQFQPKTSEAPSFPDFPPVPVADTNPKAPVITPAPKPQTSQGNPFAAMPPAPAPEESGAFDIANAAPQPEAGVVHPSGVSAVELYERGLKHYMDGRHQEAYDAFLHCHRTGQKLDPYREQSLHEMLQSLRPLVQKQNANGIRQVNNEETGGTRRVGPGTDNEFPNAIDLAKKEKSVKFEKLRSEVLNAVFQADRLKEKQPVQAKELIDRTLATVSDSDLSEEQVAPLVKQLQLARGDVEAWEQQRAPMIELQKRNEETLDVIRQRTTTEVRIEQEVAKLVDEYNELFKQRRFAEAEQKAKEAMELDPENPVTVTMFWKARFGRRDAANNDLKLAKEAGFFDQMMSAEESAIPFDDRDPYRFGDKKKWEDMTKRRSGYGTDNRIKSEQEIQIEKSLTRPISLHFTETPLAEVLKHVSTAAGINVVVDNLGLSDEGILPDHPVTINVDNITLKSALELTLGQLDLSYVIESEVLKVTSRIREQGKMIVATYPVADLVIAIPNFRPSGGVGLQSSGPANNAWNGPANFSIPAGGSLTPAGAQFQVGDAFGGPPPINDPWGAPGLQSDLAGGGSAVDFDTLSELIVSTIEPESWQEAAGNGSIRAYETTLSLVIRQTQKVHEEIRDLLEQLRRLQDLQVTIEVRFITVADRFFERIGIDFDFNVQDNIEGDDLGRTPPAFGAPLGAGVQGAQGVQGVQGQAGQGQLGVGGIGGGPGAMNALIMGVPGQVTGQVGQAGQQAGQAGQQAGQAGQQGGIGGQFLTPPTNLNLPALDDWPKNGSVVGLSRPGAFTPDLDVAFQQGSFDLGVPDFGNFNPDAGIQVGMAILTDIEAFFFIQAAQADERTNIMFAPKVTLFNGQQASVQSTTQRPFVTSLIPTVGFFSVGFTPQITVLSEGVTLQVLAVISADRRFVRLTVVPNFTNITDVFTFSFTGGGGGGGGQAGQNGAANNGVAGGGGFNPVGGQGAGGLAGQQGGGGQTGFGGIGGGPMATNALSLGLPTQIGGVGGLVGGQAGGQVGGQQGGQGAQGGQGGGQVGGVGGAVGNTTIQQPVFEVVNVTTTVSVPDGGTVLLGGIKRLREGRSMAGVPILNKIPYISRLFKNTGVGRETESLMLMVTPRIIIQEEEEELLGIPQ